MRVKECRAQRVRDGLSFERPTVLVWTKRRFRCATPGCVGSFTEPTRQVPAWRAIAAAARRKIAGLPTCPPRRLGIVESVV